MKKNVVGVFVSSFEAVKAIDSMIEDGIDRKHIYVLAHDNYATGLIEDSTGVDAEAGIELNSEPRSFWEELTSFFTKKDHPSGYVSHLKELGVNEADVERYGTEVDAGKILVLVDSQYDRNRTGVLSESHISEDSSPLVDDLAARETAAAVSQQPVDEIETDHHNLNTLKEDLQHQEESRQFIEPQEAHLDGKANRLANESDKRMARVREFDEEPDLFHKGQSTEKRTSSTLLNDDHGNNLDGQPK